MKIFSIALGLMLLAQTSNDCNAQSAGIDSNSVNQAISVLTSTKPMLEPLAGLGYVDPIKRKICTELYQSQIDAISVLGQEKVPGTVQYLIPFLNYPSKTYSDPGRGSLGFSRQEDTNYTPSEWPALSAILDIPDASKNLKAYALDKKNPVRFRFAAFSALRYLNEQDCKSVGDALSEEFSGSNAAQVNIKAVERGSLIYSGTIFAP